jgi:hypothetical protein
MNKLITQRKYSGIEKLDQSSTSIQTCVSAGNRTRVAYVAGKHSSKELFEQLLYLLLGTTICAGILTLLWSQGFSPRHSVNNLYHGCYSETGSILSWSVILSVYDADTIAIDLSLSALIS